MERAMTWLKVGRFYVDVDESVAEQAKEEARRAYRIARDSGETVKRASTVASRARSAGYRKDKNFDMACWYCSHCCLTKKFNEKPYISNLEAEDKSDANAAGRECYRSARAAGLSLAAANRLGRKARVKKGYENENFRHCCSVASVFYARDRLLKRMLASPKFREAPQ
jgi:hypothetical protein